MFSYPEMSRNFVDNRSDNNEFFTRDNGLLCKNEFDHEREVGLQGKIPIGLMGRIMGIEIMNRVR